MTNLPDQNQKRVRLGKSECSFTSLIFLIRPLIIKLTFMLQAATLKTSGKKQWHRAESKESNDEGGDPDSDLSFTLTALDSQSSMRKINLRIISAAISHNDTRWNAAANIGTIIFGNCASLQETSFISSVTKPSTSSSLWIMFFWKTKHQAPTSKTFSVTS